MNYQRNYGMRRFGLFPPILKSLLIVNAAVFVLQHFMLSVFTLQGYPLDIWFMKYFALQPVFDGNTLLDNTFFYPWQLISYQFMHANFWHIFFNLFALWMFGSELEETWGAGKFLTFYLLTGIGAGLVQLFISPMLGSIAPTVGASGAVYGILLAFGLTNPERPIYMFPFFIPIKAKLFVVIMIAIELIFGFSVSDSVARFAHLGGAATGFLLLKFGDKLKIYKLAEKFLNKRRGGYNPNYDPYGSSYSNQTYEPKIHRFSWSNTPKQEPTVYSSPSSNKIALNLNGEDITQAKVDEILDKISAQGYQSLSEKEKYILTELSKKL